MRSVCCLIGVLITSPLAAQREHPLLPAIKLAEKSAAAAEKLTGYTATFTKREYVGRKQMAHTIAIKVRHDPFSVYMRFVNPAPGREVIYVKGKNNGNLLAHDVGIRAVVGTVSLNPTSKQALSESKYPITRFGLKTMVKIVIDEWKKKTQWGECDVKYFPNAKLGNQAVEVIQCSHPKPRKQFRYHITRLYVDKTSRLPVRVESYAWPKQPGGKPVLVEQYTYTNVKTNPGLADRDFDRRNPAYRFR